MMTLTRREPFVLLLLEIIFLTWSGWAPADRSVWVLEVVPAIAGVLILCVTYTRFPMTPLSYRLVFAFSLILMVGGHYTYANVPLGLWVRDAFGFSRNHFDRLGHLMQGVVPALLMRELLLRVTPLRPGKMLFSLCVATALAISAFYEIFEWWTAVLVAPEQGISFLGTQGDIWDAQKDMLMAMIGAAVGQLLFSRIQDRELKRLRQ